MLSNKTDYSPTDPEARISIKPGKARALNYLCNLAVDTAQGVISHIQADFADRRDSVYLPMLTQRIQQRLTANELRLQELLADAGYSTGSNYALLEQRGITPWIPVHGPYKPEIEGFPYDPIADHFTCPAGKRLPFQKYCTDPNGGWQKYYRAPYQDCQQCPRKPIRVPKSQCRPIVRTAYDAAYKRALARQRSPQGGRLKRLRHSTVEPVFGSLIHHYGLRRIGMRGKLPFQRRTRSAGAKRRPVPPEDGEFCNSHGRILRQPPTQFFPTDTFCSSGLTHQNWLSAFAASGAVLQSVVAVKFSNQIGPHELENKSRIFDA